MNEQANLASVQNAEHWTRKGDVRLFLWRKSAVEPHDAKGTVLFVHGSSMASQPTFDLNVPGRPDSSVMDWFAVRGFDTWCMDNEGYGRSDKTRPINCDIANGADDLEAATSYILSKNGGEPLLGYGISSGALAAAGAARCAGRRPGRVRRLALDAFGWPGEGTPPLEQRASACPSTRRRTAG